MPTRSQPWYAVGLRFCASCLATLACWALWLGLGTTLVILIYVAVAKELPVPGFVLRRAEAELARADLNIRFGRARFDPTGKILLQDVQLRSRQFEDPLLTCRLLYLRRDFWSVLAGRPVPDEIRLEGAALQLPAMLSPGGTAEPILSDVALVLQHEENRWLVTQFSGRVGPLVITAEGGFVPPAHAPGATAFSPDQLVSRYLEIGRRLALDLHRLGAFEEPALAVHLDSPAGVGNTAAILFTAKAAREPWGQPVSLGPLAATTTLRLAAGGSYPVRLHAAARAATYQGKAGANHVRAIFATSFRADDFSLRPLELLLAAGDLTVDGEKVVGPVFRTNLTRLPDIRTEVAAQVDGGFLAAEVEAQLAGRSARIRAGGRMSHEAIGRVLRRHTPRAAPYFVFGDPVDFQAEAFLAPGWRFDRLHSRVAAGRLDSRGVQITSARGRIDIVGTSFLAHDARVTMGANGARGSYWMDFATTDYRMLLTGRLKPAEINGWFRGDWWLGFWNRYFAFQGPPPEAEVDVQGRWRDASRTTYFGRSEAQSARVWGGDFDSARATVFVRPNFAHAYDLDGLRAGGTQRLEGWIKRFTDPVTRETNRLEFDFDSSFDTTTIGRMLEGRADEVLASLKLSAPPRVRAHGAIAGKWPGATPNYSFAGQAQGPLHYFGFPLESAQVRGGVTGADVRLDDIQFTAAGGKGAGNASLSGPPDFRRLGFDVYLNGADLARSIRAVEEYQAARTGQPVVAAAESKFMRRASGGRLDVALSAQGEPGEIATFAGTGNAALTGIELGEIQLFGLLSQVLSGLSLNFSSLKLDEARSSFRLEGGKLNFPDLKITGSSAVIDARGSYTFDTTALDFVAGLKPFEENRNLLTMAIGIVINPITSILELKLTGPLSNPDWSIVVGPSGAHPEIPSPVPATPPVDKALAAPKG